MLHLFKLFWFVVKELLFDSKEEYDFRNKNFNSRRMTAAVLLMLSFVLNVWLLQRFYTASTNYIDLRAKHDELVLESKAKGIEADRLKDQLEEAEATVKKLKARPRIVESKPTDKKPHQGLIQ